MTAPTDLNVVCAISHIFGDVGLYLAAIVAYLVLSRFRSKAQTRKCCQESFVVSEHGCSQTVEPVAPRHVQDKIATAKQQNDPQTDVSMQIELMQKHASERNIRGVMHAFHLIQESGECLSIAMYNIVLQAWINCG